MTDFFSVLFLIDKDTTIRCPGLHRDDQVAGWRKVTDAVHAAVARIVCQI